MELLIVALVLGVILAIVAALAIWLVLGNWTLMWRAIFVIVGASGVALVFCAASGEFEAEWLGLVWVTVVTITAMFVFVRWLGLQLADTTNGGRIRSDEMQFSLMQLMSLPTMKPTRLLICFALVNQNYRAADHWRVARKNSHAWISVPRGSDRT